RRDHAAARYTTAAIVTATHGARRGSLTRCDDRTTCIAGGARMPHAIAIQTNRRSGPVKISTEDATGGGNHGSHGISSSAGSQRAAPRRGAGRTRNASPRAPIALRPSDQKEGRTPSRTAPDSGLAMASVPREIQSATPPQRNAPTEEGDSRLAVIRRACYHRI